MPGFLYCLGEMIASDDDHPFFLMENTGFCRFVAEMAPHYQLPHQMTLGGRVVIDLYWGVRQLVQQEVGQGTGRTFYK